MGTRTKQYFFVKDINSIEKILKEEAKKRNIFFLQLLKQMGLSHSFFYYHKKKKENGGENYITVRYYEKLKKYIKNIDKYIQTI